MATVFKPADRRFEENPGRADHFRLFTDISRAEKGVEPATLNFDVRRLDPGQFSSTYHFHRHGEEMFVVLTGSATLRTPDGLETVEAGDIIFMEAGPTGAHQLYNHTGAECTYLDIRTFTGQDMCEYPDSGKILLVPSMETFRKDSALEYFDGQSNGENNIRQVWADLKSE